MASLTVYCIFHITCKIKVTLCITDILRSEYEENISIHCKHFFACAAPIRCQICGDYDNDISCDLVSVYKGPFVDCTEGPYCMNDIVHEQGNVKTFKRFDFRYISAERTIITCISIIYDNY